MSDRMNLADRLAVFLTQRRVLVIAALVIVVVVIVAAAVWTPVRSSMADKNARVAEEIDQLFSDWLYAGDDQQSGLEEQFLSTASAAADGKAEYPAQRALFMRGQYYINKEMWPEASADFAALAERFPRSYLAPVALFNAASTSEEAGDPAKASEFYTRLVEGYGDSSAEVAEALFNLGRLAEEGGDKEKAREYYNRLVADYDTSDWKNIAKTRILLMK